MHAFRNVVLPVLGPQCIITTGRSNCNASVIVDREGMGVAMSNRSSYCVDRFHFLASVPHVVCDVWLVADWRR